jgi:hypothetical protein
LSNLRSLYDSLQLPAGASPQDKQRRGREFEVFLAGLLRHAGLNPRLRMRPTGEEIDGSFELDGKIYLLEAKWYAASLPASSVYAFKGKVDGKLVGTIGVFDSMSGYGEDAIDALTAGKVLNVLLLDRADVEAALEHGVSRVLRAKVRAAAEEGVVFFPFTSLLADVRANRRTETAEVPTDELEADSAWPEVVVICEGTLAVRIISILGRRVLEENGKSATLRVVAAQGKQSVPRLANALYPLLGTTSPIIAVIDGDGDIQAAAQTVTDAADVPLDLIVVDPELEAWFYPDVESPRAEARTAALRDQKPLDEHLDELGNSVGLRQLFGSASGFQQFYQAILHGAQGGEDRRREERQ